MNGNLQDLMQLNYTNRENKNLSIASDRRSLGRRQAQELNGRISWFVCWADLARLGHDAILKLNQKFKIRWINKKWADSRRNMRDSAA